MHRLAVLLAALTGILCAKNVTNPYQSCPLEKMQFASEGSFYVWNTTGPLPGAAALSRFSAQRIYVRYFDVVNGEGPEPAGIRHDVTTDIEVVPVIYITVPALEGLSEVQISSLAQNIVRLIGKIGFSGNEIQLDCDWNAGTKIAFFSLIQKLRELSSRKWGRPIQISATIRLHQLKYVRSTGIPPADRG
ncbi:MAG: hypothetical protein KDK37_14780, partial [Leptospiraceae bacterium]|nr:hypothetical protein [Leptospiraceae bacterium]